MAHRIALVVGSELHELLASVEGDDREVFPPSPPLQQWALTELGGGKQAALLMGMAGRSHWSLSVEPGAAERLIRFEVACRAPAVDRPALRSVYQMRRPWQWSPDAQAAVVSVDGYRCLLRPLRLPDADGPPILRVERDQLAVFPPELTNSSTHRWQYELSLTY